MSKINPDAPAFPLQKTGVAEINDERWMSTGMSIRAYFAAEAMKVIDPPDFYFGDEATNESLSKWAKDVCKVADAVITELNKS